ncbi:6981_t:CDS:1, partial [Gigaspora margarita]
EVTTDCWLKTATVITTLSNLSSIQQSIKTPKFLNQKTKEA